MRRALSLLCFTVSIASFLAPGILRADQIDDLCLQGLENLYNVRFDDAAALFDRAIAADPQDPRGYFFRANVHLWSFVFDNNKAQLTLFMQASDKTKSVAERRLSADPKDVRAGMFLGMTYGYRAIAHARAENFTAAALSAKSCYDQLKDVVRTDPKMYDAYLGLGLFHFMFGSIPRIGQFLAGMTGIQGNAPLGIREIQAAAGRGRYFKSDAQFISSMLDIYFNGKSDDGFRALDAQVAKYPRNVALLYAEGAILLNRRQPKQAIEKFEKIIQQDNRDFLNFTALSCAQVGKAYFTMSEYAKAKGYLQKFLKTARENPYRTSSWYMLGVCYEMTGDRATAVKAYDRAVAGVTSSSPDDRVGQRRASILLTAPMSENDKNVLRALSSLNATMFVPATEFANQILNSKDATPAQRSQALYVCGVVLQTTAHYDDAISAYNSALAIKHTETWVYPYSYFHRGECYKLLGDKKKWEEDVDRAKGFHQYDNEVELRFKIQRDVSTID